MAGNRSLISFTWGPAHASLQKRIVAPFMTNCGGAAVAGNHECVVVEGHELLFNRPNNFGGRTTPEIGPADALHEESVTGKQNIAVTREMKGGAAGCVAGCVNDSHF